MNFAASVRVRDIFTYIVSMDFFLLFVRTSSSLVSSVLFDLKNHIFFFVFFFLHHHRCSRHRLRRHCCSRLLFHLLLAYLWALAVALGLGDLSFVNSVISVGSRRVFVHRMTMCQCPWLIYASSIWHFLIIQLYYRLRTESAHRICVIESSCIECRLDAEYTWGYSLHA